MRANTSGDDHITSACVDLAISFISFVVFFSFIRLETKFFESSPPFKLAGEKGSKIVFLKERSLNVILTSSGKRLHQYPSIKPVGNAGQNSLLTAWNDLVLCNSKEDENSLKVVDLKELEFFVPSECSKMMTKKSFFISRRY